MVRNGLKKCLGSDKFVIADRGYSDSRCIQLPDEHPPKHRVYETIRARHEVVNKGLKQFGVPSMKFHHELLFNGTCFLAAANVTDLILTENPMLTII